MKRYWTNEQIERRAEERVVEYERRFGALKSPPVPIERLIDEVFDLQVLWETISTEAGLNPLAGIRPSERRIVINEAHRARFEEKPGLLNFTYGHELGHWDLHIDHAALNHPTLEGFESPPPAAFRHHRTPSGLVEVIVSRLHREGLGAQEVHDVVRRLTRDMDDFFEGRQVNRYAAALLMPKALVLRSSEGLDLAAWPTLYRLAERFAVSITALRIRLEGLGLIHVADDGTIHRSKVEYMGQQRLL